SNIPQELRSLLDQGAAGTSQPNLLGATAAAQPAYPGASLTPTPSTPVTQIEGGGYWRHYLHSGENTDEQFYLEVTFLGFYHTDGAPPGSGDPQASFETGSVVYTAWLKDQGNYVFNWQNIAIPFEAPLGSGSGAGLTTDGSEVNGFNLATFGLDNITWDHQF